MKKDIEWTKEEIGELPCVDTVFNSGGSSYIDSAVPVMAVYDLLDQLDEPEVEQLYIKIRNLESFNDFLIRSNNQLRNEKDNQEILSQEWIDNNSVYASSDGVTDECVHVDDLQNLLVPKQELPVIPNYIADFLNERKDWALFEIFDDVYLHNEHPRVNEWLYGDGIEVPQGREIKMVMALKFGYKLEPEQKYYVRDQHGVYLLAKNHREQGNVQTVAEIVEQYGIEEIELDYELTEQEIKDYDEHYFAFAVKVEELEE